jgi:WD40 repeat protein
MEPVAMQRVVKTRQVISLDKEGFRVAWHPSEKRLAVLDGDLNLIEFDAITGQIIHVLPTLIRGALTGGIAYSPDGKYLIGGNGVISVFDAGSGQKVKEILGPYEGDPHGAQGLDTLTISPDSRLVAVRYSQYKHTNRANISVFEIDTGRLVFSLPDIGDKVHASIFSGNLVFTPDGKSLLSPRYEFLTASETKRRGEAFHYSVYLDTLDARTGKVTRTIPSVHVQRITAQAVSADGKLIATGTNTLGKESTLNETTGGWDYINNQDPIRIWSAETGKIQKELGPLRGAVSALSFSHDGSLLASCQTDLTNKETLWLWDVASGQLIERVKTPNSAYEFFDCAFSPSGRRLAFPVNRQLYLFDMAR